MYCCSKKRKRGGRKEMKINNVCVWHYKMRLMRMFFVFVSEGLRDSVIGTSRRLLSRFGSLSRDASPCPTSVSKCRSNVKKKEGEDKIILTLYTHIHTYTVSSGCSSQLVPPTPNYEIIPNWLALFANASSFFFFCLYTLLALFSFPSLDLIDLWPYASLGNRLLLFYTFIMFSYHHRLFIFPVLSAFLPENLYEEQKN